MTTIALPLRKITTQHGETMAVHPLAEIRRALIAAEEKAWLRRVEKAAQKIDPKDPLKDSVSWEEIKKAHNL